MKKIPTTKSKIRFGFQGMNADTDESNMDFSMSPFALNLTFSGGALRGEIGLDRAQGYYEAMFNHQREYPSLPNYSSARDTFVYFRRNNGAYDDRLVAQCADGKLYQTKIFETDTWHEIAGVNGNGHFCAVNYNYNGTDVLLLSSENAGLIMLDGSSAISISAAPKFSSLAVHNERVYGTLNGDTNQVWFSDDFNPTNWSVSSEGAGYINFNDECGDVLEVVSFLNYLYIFRENGIFRLTAYGDQSEFAIKRVYSDTGRIYKPTIAVCGDRILFLSAEGLCSFDGYDVTKIGKALPKIASAKWAWGAYYDNKYFLSCFIDELKTRGIYDNAESLNNVVIALDIRKNTYAILGPVDCKSVRSASVHQASDVLVTLWAAPAKEMGSVQMMSQSGKIDGTVTDKYYFTPCSDFGTGDIKIVRSVSICTHYDLVLSVIADGVTSDFGVKGSGAVQKIFIGISGTKIGFGLKMQTEKVYVTPPVAEIEVL